MQWTISLRNAKEQNNSRAHRSEGGNNGRDGKRRQRQREGRSVGHSDDGAKSATRSLRKQKKKKKRREKKNKNKNKQRCHHLLIAHRRCWRDSAPV